MNDNTIRHTRRTIIAAMTLPLLPKGAFATGSEVPIAPCSFPFDASKSGTILDEQFRVTVHRNYIFVLEFHHVGGDDGKRVQALVGDGSYRYFTKESADTDHPVYPHSEFPNTLAGMQKRDEAVRAGTLVMRSASPGVVIPIRIRVSTVSDQTSEIVEDETIKTAGAFAGGAGRIKRMLTVVALKPDLYRIQANTMQDSPRFTSVPISLGITYHSKEMPLSPTR